MRSKTTALLVLLVAGLLAAHPAVAQPPSCPALCDTNKLAPVTNPGASSTDIISAVKVTLDTILGAITDFAEPVGALASGAQQLMDTGYSLWTAWNSVANPQQSVKNSLHNDMVKLQDYLVCEVQNIVSQAENDIVKHMNQQQLNTFNAFIDNTINTLNDECGALNCLNASNLAPSKRHAATNDNCVVGKPALNKGCAGVTVWDTNNITTCQFLDGTTTYSGICDTDGLCYTSDVSQTGAQNFFTGVIAEFNGGNINNIFGLDQFAPDDVTALSLGAKMSLLQINMYQQLIMLGSTKGENDTMKAFANTAADWMERRYNYITDINRFRSQIGNYSTLTNGVVTQDGIINPQINGASNLQEHGDTATATCNTGGGYQAGVACFLYSVQYGSYRIAYGCDPSQQQPLFQQTEQTCYWANHIYGGQNFGHCSQAAPCACDTLPYAPITRGNTNNWGNPTGTCQSCNILGACTCTLDNTVESSWLGSHNDELATMYAQAKEALAQKLSSQLVTTLADVKGVITNLRKLAQVGMPGGSLNIFQTSYPLQQCDVAQPAARNAAAGVSARNFAGGSTGGSTGGASPLKGDGAVPLPAGAVIRGAVAPGAARGGAAAGRKLLL